MVFDPQQLLSFADILYESKDLCDNDEEEIIKFVTVVNRAYYAVYLKISDILWNNYNEKPQKSGDHSRTRYSLTTKMNRPELKEMYQTLYRERVEADYHIKRNINNGKDFGNFARGSKDTAEYLLKELENHY
jgi:hypothetical protein